MHIYICMYIHIYMHICIYIYICMYNNMYALVFRGSTACSLIRGWRRQCCRQEMVNYVANTYHRRYKNTHGKDVLGFCSSGTQTMKLSQPGLFF